MSIETGMEQIQAPFTEEQCNGLNWYQQYAPMHPFTCANRDDGKHPNEGILVAAPDGWHCLYCKYTQDWAWKMMADPANFPSLPWD